MSPAADAAPSSAHADSHSRSPRTAGRKLDLARNAEILDATLEVLAEVGYDAMTIDLVAARAGAARATVYRRWATKADLAVDAVRHLSEGDVGEGPLPDLGTLRGDLVALIAPHDTEQQQLRIRVLSGLATLARTDPRLAGTSLDAGLQPWIDSCRTLLQRAVDRGEFPDADVTTLAQVMPLMAVCRAAVQQQPITHEFALAMIDGVIIPAMRGSAR